MRLMILLTMLVLGGCGGSASDAKLAQCLQGAADALDKSHQALGAPAALDFDSLQRIVTGARSDLGAGIRGDPQARVSVSVLSGKIRIWANCGGKEGTRDWVPRP